MRKYLFATLVALCISVPGSVNAVPVSPLQIAASPEIAPHLVEAILHAASEQTEWTFEELYQHYLNEDLRIEKNENGYQILENGGGAVIIIELEDII